MKLNLTLLFLLVTIVINNVKADNDLILHRLYQTANIADINADSKFIHHLDSLLSQHNDQASLLINGDLFKGNIGKQDSIKINNLLSLSGALTKGKLIILAGNRDWDDSGKDGLKKVKKLEKYVRSFDYENVVWPLKKGCPGPKTIKLDDNVLLVTFNTQWWNHPFNKPGPQDADCNIATTDNFLEELEDALDDNSDKNVIIAGHYPIISLGEYGGHIPFQKHLFPLDDLYIPLPVFGSLYAGYRQNIGNSRDIINENFAEIQQHLQNIISHRNSLIYLSGHERNLQILQKEQNYFINSGAPTRGKYIANDSDALLAEDKAGVIELIYYKSGKVDSKVHFYDKKTGFNSDKTFNLYQSACIEKSTKTLVNKSYSPCKGSLVESKTTTQSIEIEKTIIAGEEYEAGSVKRFFWGDHYRDSWTAPVTVPILNLDTTFNGLTPYKRGGGRQTKSLKFKAGNGMRYAFRSVNKDPAKALPWNLRETIAQDIVKDQTTTQNPYGAMAADILLNELGILHAHPKLYVMPDDERLGPFKEEFGNMLGMLEENPSKPKKGEVSFAGADKIYRSHQMFRQLYKDHNNHVATHEFARARVFDILVGDWGKHEDNWKWAAYKTHDAKLFRPLPRDRDHVFSRWDGLIPWLADREWAKESGENFGFEIDGLRSLMFQARHLDRFIANGLSKEEWLDAAEFVSTRITDDIIKKAVANMPTETYSLSGKTIEQKLKTRVQHLEKYALEYYQMLAKEVDVVGSAKDEYFDVVRNRDGSVNVKMYAADKTGNKMGAFYLYNRTFYPDETDEVRLFGLDGKDVFNVQGKSDQSILIRLIGGPKPDNYTDNSAVNSFGSYTFIYENSSKAQINLGTEADQIFGAAPQAYDYDRNAFAYDTYMPIPFVSFNADDGFSFNLDYEISNQAYGKKDYDTRHNFSLGLATSGTFSLGYEFRLHHFLGEWDLTTRGNWAQPGDVFNYFGLGNKTIKDDDLYLEDFYESRRNERKASLGIIREFWKKSSFNFYVGYEFSEMEDENNRSISKTTNLFGIENTESVNSNSFLDLDFRDNGNLPKSGMRLYVQNENGFVTTNSNSHFGKTFGFLEYFNTAQIILPITLGLKGGLGGSFGDIPYFKLYSLGQEEFLRGFRKNRFLGKKMAFFNSDLRLHLLTWHSSIVPVEIGVKGFFDSGKIVEDKISKGKWHNSYGVGFFFVPLEKDFTINASVAFSKEESGLFTIGIGTAFK